MPLPGSPVRLIVNGEPCEIAVGSTLTALLAGLDLDVRRVAVAVNGAVVPRTEWIGLRLTEGDRVEIITAVGGG